jgi:hypothetical protein
MSNVSTESKVSKNFRMDRLLRDSGNIIEQEPAAAVPPNPPMALNVVGTSKSAMALAASVKQLQPQQQQMMVPTSTIGNCELRELSYRLVE